MMGGCVVHIIWVPAPGVGVTIGSRVKKSCLSNNKKTTEADLAKLRREMERGGKVCRPQELGSYARGQVCSRVTGRIVPGIVLLMGC